MVNPLISVILPVYNGANYLSEAIESILSQTFKNFELIIINDGSSDNSLNIAQVYKEQDSRIVLISQQNIGLIATLNKGILLTKGKYIARMDQDDISFEDRFTKQVELLDSGYDICGCNFNVINENGEIIDNEEVETENFSLVLMSNVPFAHGAVMMRRSFLSSNNLKYGQTKYIKAEDYQFWCSIFECGGRFGNVPECLFQYRDVEGSLSSDKRNMYHASMISYEFMNNNEPKLVQDILDADVAVKNKFKYQIACFSLLTLFSGFKVKLSLLNSSHCVFYSIIRLLKMFRIRLLSKFND